MMSGPSRIIAVDPGVRSSGWAVFALVEGWYTLEEAGFVPTDHWPPEAINMWPHKDVEIIIEDPAKYPTKNIYHRDIDRLKIVVDTLASYAESMGWDAYMVKPSQWKGQVPKKVHHARIIKNLSDQEAQAVLWPQPSLCHNVFDAIGLGLYRVQRLGRGGKKISAG